MDKDQDFKITKLMGNYDSPTGKGRKLLFKTEQSGDKQISVLTEWPDNLKEGGTIFGHINTKESNGKTYYNFFFGKKDRGPAANNAATSELKNAITLGIIPKLDELLARVGAISDRLDRFIDEENIQTKF